MSIPKNSTTKKVFSDVYIDSVIVGSVNKQPRLFPVGTATLVLYKKHGRKDACCGFCCFYSFRCKCTKSNVLLSACNLYEFMLE